MTDKKFIFKKNDNDEYLGIKCFQVNPDVEMKDVPTNGEEYLLKVMAERANYASVAICKLKNSEIHKKPSISTFKEIQHPEIPDKLKPTIEWQNIQTADFSDLHMYVVRMAAKRKGELQSIFQSSYKEYLKDDVIQWQSLITNIDPTLSHVVGLTQPKVDPGLETVLSMLHKVKPGQSIDRRTGLWLHALLVVTRQPTQPDTSYLLRRLSRRCAEIRSNINLDDENAVDLATPLNIFICIIAKYFGQHDLGDYELHDSKVAQIYL
ncbi:unnamed protein product [Chrysodeixis includens]|uniref:Gem-associated protein 2 n=1 Tax=Chrysodeixis includens TaxID=689277 RepID=A0A9N8KTK5_CHRIL|nr:unnamed protein product [Chrysodeixis includens]